MPCSRDFAPTILKRALRDTAHTTHCKHIRIQQLSGPQCKWIYNWRPSIRWYVFSIYKRFRYVCVCVCGCMRAYERISVEHWCESIQFACAWFSHLVFFCVSVSLFRFSYLSSIVQVSWTTFSRTFERRASSIVICQSFIFILNYSFFFFFLFVFSQTKSLKYIDWIVE